ncbi:RIIB lysis inhibitor [Vibrio phage F94]
MARTNIVKCKTEKQKVEIFKSWNEDDWVSKRQLARLNGIPTRTLNRILEEVGSDSVCSEYDYAVTKKQITIIKDGESRSVVKGYPRFKEIKELLVSCDFSDKVLSETWELVNLPKYIAKFTEGQLTVDHEGGKVWYNTFEIKNSLSDQLIKMLNEGKEVTGFVKFTEYLLENPKESVIEELYPFLTHNGISITNEGMIEAYRSITVEYKDHHTRTMDNSIGSVVKMPRTMVDDNPERTCSKGLHVASFEYANTFGGERRLVKVLVNPVHVVSVPTDYNGQKLRCCEFKILKEVL